MTAPIAVRVTRYQDPHCGRTHSSRRRAVEHMGRCWRNPDARGCLTCRHFEPAVPGDLDTGWPGNDEGCAVGVSLAGRPGYSICEQHIDPDGPFGTSAADDCPDCKTDSKAVKPGPIVHCEKWQALESAAPHISYSADL